MKATAETVRGLDPSRIYSIEEVCSLWKLTRRWIIDNWVKPRAVAFTRQGDLILFHGRNIERWLETNQTDAR